MAQFRMENQRKNRFHIFKELMQLILKKKNILMCDLFYNVDLEIYLKNSLNLTKKKKNYNFSKLIYLITSIQTKLYRQITY